MSHVADNVGTDPTLPKIELKIGKMVFHPVFTFEALAIAEIELKKVGHVVNIFAAMDFDNMDATKMVALLYASLITENPSISLAEIPKMVTVRQIPAIKQALLEAFVLSMADPDEEAADPLVQE